LNVGYSFTITTSRENRDVLRYRRLPKTKITENNLLYSGRSEPHARLYRIQINFQNTSFSDIKGGT
jgi:hypothetical protein